MQLDCSNNSLPAADFLKATFTVDSNGDVALRYADATALATGNDFVGCDNSAISKDELIKSLLKVNAAGDLAIQVVLVTDSGVDYVTCATNYWTLEDLNPRAIELLSDGSGAIRLAITAL